MKKVLVTLFLLFIVVLSTLFMGCGNDADNSEDNNHVDKGPWFEPAFHDFKLGEDEFVPVFSFYNNEIYFIADSVDEKTDAVHMVLKKISLDDYSVSDLAMFSSKATGLILNLYVDASGIYMTGQNVQGNKEPEYNIVVCDLDGTIRENMDITEMLKDKVSENEAVYLTGIICDNEGNIIVTDNTTFVMAFNGEGEKIADINCDYWGNGFLKSADGTVYYSYTNELTWKQCFAPVDVKADKLGKRVGEVASLMTYNYCIDANEAVWFSEENTLTSYNLKTEEKEVILDWIDYDITTDSVRMVEVLEDGSIVVCLENLSQDQLVYEIAVFKESTQPLEEKTVITYATFGTDTDIMEAIVRFNKNSEEYRIKVIDYYDEENYEEAWNEYNQAVLDENFADIVNVGWSNYKMMAEKGLYANLNDFMDSDADINRGDYFENILSAYEVDGKLYAIPVSFSVSTLVGKEEIWGNRETISLDDVKEMMDDMPANVEIMDNITQDAFVFFMLQGSLDKFVDWETGECSFASKEFVEILNLSKRFPEESGETDSYNEMITAFQKNKVLLYDCELYGIEDYQVTKTMLGDEIVALGYPSANGGLIQSDGSLLAISEESPNKEAAWEFVKCMISEEYQTNYIYYNNPIHKGAFEKRLQSAMETNCYIDDNGNEVEKSKMSYVMDDLEIEVYAATKADAEEYRKIIEGATTLATYEQKIMTIVEEESEAFFADQKSAEDAAKIIQSRAKIYVNERR